MSPLTIRKLSSDEAAELFSRRKDAVDAERTDAGLVTRGDAGEPSDDHGTVARQTDVAPALRDDVNVSAYVDLLRGLKTGDSLDVSFEGISLAELKRRLDAAGRTLGLSLRYSQAKEGRPGVWGRRAGWM